MKNIGFHLRETTAADTATILRHRRAMFEDIGFSDQKIRASEQETTAIFTEAIENGNYHGWFIETDDGQVVSGAGVFILPFYPSPREPVSRRPWIVNVYTEPEYRKRGFGRRLVKTAVEWCQSAGFTYVHLHASPAGRPLYETLGFRLTNEMRLAFNEEMAVAMLKSED